MQQLHRAVLCNVSMAGASSIGHVLPTAACLMPGAAVQGVCESKALGAVVAHCCAWVPTRPDCAIVFAAWGSSTDEHVST